MFIIPFVFILFSLNTQPNIFNNKKFNDNNSIPKLHTLES